LAVALAGAAVMAFSGCFTFVGIDYTKSKMKPGDTTKVTVTSIPASTTAQRGYFFLFIGTPNDNSLVAKANGAQFDLKGNYKGPKPLRNDDALRDEIVSEGSCGSFNLSDFPNSTFKTLRTNNPVKDQGTPQDEQVSQFKADDAGLFTSVPPTQVLVATGYWNDDGDGIPESGDTITCTGGSISGLYLKPDTNPKRSDYRALARKYGVN
jgi:hypothetical protein